MRVFAWPALLTLTALCASCASTPDVTLTHFAPLAELSVTVTRTVRCSSDETQFMVTHAVTPVQVYRADRTRPLPLDISALRSAWANTELSVTWFDDGRLEGINTSATGQGSTIVSAITATLSKVAGRSHLLIERLTSAPKNVKHPACGVVGQWLATDEKSLTLTYTTSKTDGLGAVTLALSPTADSAERHKSLASWLKPLTLTVAPGPQGPAPVVQAEGANAGAAQLTLAVPVVARMAVSIGNDEAWTADAIVPGRSTYRVPIPRARPFGKHVFAVSLSEGGALKSLTYNTDSGVAAALGAAQSVAGAKQEVRDARTEALKSEADYLAAQARLAKCLAKPDDCS